MKKPKREALLELLAWAKEIDTVNSEEYTDGLYDRAIAVEVRFGITDKDYDL